MGRTRNYIVAIALTLTLISCGGNNDVIYNNPDSSMIIDTTILDTIPNDRLTSFLDENEIAYLNAGFVEFGSNSSVDKYGLFYEGRHYLWEEVSNTAVWKLVDLLEVGYFLCTQETPTEDDAALRTYNIAVKHLCTTS